MFRRQRLRKGQQKNKRIEKIIRKAREGFSYFYKGDILYYV